LFMPWTLRSALVNTSPPATRNKQVIRSTCRPSEYQTTNQTNLFVDSARSIVHFVDIQYQRFLPLGHGLT
jgi:hypothetical protein